MSKITKKASARYLASVEAAAKALAAKNIALFAKLAAAAEASGNWEYRGAIFAAEVNANDTLCECSRSSELDFPSDETAADLASWALGSLCSTAEFDGSAEVREFFLSLGYKY